MDNIKSQNQPEILLVDDSPEHIEASAGILGDNNFRIRVATNGTTALKLIKQHQPDLILLDIYMPKMDGFEICRIIKSNPDYSDIPIIFLTASNDEESIKKGFELGAQDYVIKPFNPSELLARVNTHIALKQHTEYLVEANKELGSFCYSVSHDLKAPLLSICKLSEFLSADYSKVLDGEGQNLLSIIQKKSNEMVSIVDKLLDFSKMCEKQIENQTIDLNSVFSEVYNELVEIEPKRQINFKLHTLPQIVGDPVMIRLLIRNILSNALKYTRNREVALIEAVSVENELENIIYVKDNGAGFNMKYSSRLFNVFQRLHSDKEFEGSGVGLAICQKIIKRHNGRVWITGEVDRGAIFYFALPK